MYIEILFEIHVMDLALLMNSILTFEYFGNTSFLLLKWKWMVFTLEMEKYNFLLNWKCMFFQSLSENAFCPLLNWKWWDSLLNWKCIVFTWNDKKNHIFSLELEMHILLLNWKCRFFTLENWAWRASSPSGFNFYGS